jgi:hypothetical protein
VYLSIVVSIVKFLFKLINIGIDFDILTLLLHILLFGGILLRLLFSHLLFFISDFALEFISFALQLCLLMLLSAFFDTSLLNLGLNLVGLLLLFQDIVVSLLDLSLEFGSQLFSLGYAVFLLCLLLSDITKFGLKPSQRLLFG